MNGTRGRFGRTNNHKSEHPRASCFLPESCACWRLSLSPAAEAEAERSGTPAAAPPASPVLIEGAVQKGPFIVGSTVLINRLDDRGRSTPSTLVAEIEDSVGSFSFETTERGPVQIIATGYYFSELTGQISDGQLTLKALYEVGTDARQVAHVNILTHLINDRVLELIADGQPTLHEAIAQAEDELVAALADALAIADLNEFSALSLYDSATPQNNTLGNAYLAGAVYRLLQVREDQGAGVRHRDGCGAHAGLE